MIYMKNKEFFVGPSVLSKFYKMNYPKASLNSVIIYDHAILENANV